MKKIINKPETVVAEMCYGIVSAHTELEFISKYKVIKKKQINTNKVTLISGGGSGHEPAHAGFVGKGMLDAAVCGDIFASPSQIQVYQAIKATESKKGTLLIIKNYSGDMMNFKNAAYLASEDGIKVDYVKVDDDIAVEDSLYTVGRRGVAGTVLVHKVAGAAAERGAELEEVRRVALKAASNVCSIGFALTSCTVPAKGTPTLELGSDEIEYGVGIHGEPGRKREKLSTADELADRMVTSLLKELELEERNAQKTVLLINGFGGSPLQELYLLNNSVNKILAQKGITVARNFVGNYMTSIEMAGASISIMKLDDELEELINEISDAPAFKVSGPVEYVNYSKNMKEQEATVNLKAASKNVFPTPNVAGDKLTLENLIFIVNKMGEIVIRNEIPFCELDSHAGDGDFGMSVAKGFKQLQSEWDEIIEKKSGNMGCFLEACSMVIMEYCGGASGPIWGSAFRAAGRKLGAKKEASVADVAEMLHAAVEGIQTTGKRSFGRGAEVGDKTLMDALIPCADAWSDCAKKEESLKTAFSNGAKAAIDGAKKTELFVARMGRAGTVGERSLGYPDAGAHALGIIFNEISETLEWK
jgi:triose/dihydroxyacetone kinase / FAD-AMP lyase (cyclizing)